MFIDLLLDLLSLYTDKYKMLVIHKHRAYTYIFAYIHIHIYAYRGIYIFASIFIF
jgi:hypothetical protein